MLWGLGASAIGNAAHVADPLPTGVTCEHRAEPVPPESYSLMAKVDATLEQQFINVPERQREADVNHNHKADDLG